MRPTSPALLLPLLLACGNPTPAKMPPPTQAYAFTWSWRLVDARAPNPDTARLVTCTETGAALVGLAVKAGDGMISPFEWPCTSTGEGTTDPLPEGIYAVSAAVLTRDKKILSSLKPFDAPNLRGDKDLGEVLFPLFPK